MGVGGGLPGFVDADREEVEGWRRRLVLAAALTAPVILVAVVLLLMPCISCLYSTGAGRDGAHGEQLSAPSKAQVPDIWALHIAGYVLDVPLPPFVVICH